MVDWYSFGTQVLKNLGDDASGDLQQQEVHDFIDRILPLTQLYPHGVVKDDVVTVSNIVRSDHAPPPPTHHLPPLEQLEMKT